MRRLNARERRIALVTATVVVLGALYVYAIEPAVMAWLAVYREAELAEGELRKLEALVDRRAEIERDYARLEAVAAAVSSREAMAVSLLSEVAELARDAGLAVSGIKPLQTVQEKGYERAGVQVELEGEAHEFVYMLQGMQEEQHLLNGEFVNVVVGRGSAPLNISMRLTKLFFLDGSGGP